MPTLKHTYKYYYIYMIKNLINNKCYVGFHSTNGDLEKDTYYGSGALLKSAIEKYGSENFVKGIIEYINVDEWREKEKHWIKEMKSHVSMGGYNLTWGGDGTLGYVWNKDQLETLRKSQEWRLGHKSSAETKEKLRLSHLGLTQSNETIEKRASKLRGLKRSEESKERYRNSKLGSKNPMTTYKFSDEEREIFRRKAQNQKRKTCEYCGKEMFIRHYVQSHGEKCKNNPNRKIVRESLDEIK